MSTFPLALELAAAGFAVFPLHNVRPDGSCSCGGRARCVPGKHPRIERYPELACRDAGIIEDWWYQWPDANVGISTNSFQGGLFKLLVVDVDPKHGGDGSLLSWELEGVDLPTTYTQSTPSGGKHFVYRTQANVKNSVSKLAPGIDTRGRGGFIVGRGSSTAAGAYTGDLAIEVADAPKWLEDAVRVAEPSQIVQPPAVALELPKTAVIAQAADFLARHPVVPDGRRNDAAFKAAAAVRGLGVDFDSCFELMRTAFNANCLPPLEDGELRTVVENAFKYAAGAPGDAAPEREFEPAPVLETEAGQPTDDAIEKMNEQYAYALAGSNGNILWFTQDSRGRPDTRFLSVDVFHQHLAMHQVEIVRGDKKERRPLTKIWMGSRKRRTYDGVAFAPGLDVPPRFFNLWRGFAVEPVSSGHDEALEMFIHHVRYRVCGGNLSRAHWLVGYFAHMIQRPWEKPLVALCFRGEKGVGKDTLVDTVGALLGSHYFATAKRRHLVGDFNSHLERVLFFNLNEAFWAHDKQVDGVLKDLITGRVHVIERKGQEPYTVDNLLRLVVMGNEDTLIPSSWDERRWACFQVELRDLVPRSPKARKWFETLRKSMEAGGYGRLLHFLRTFDISTVDVNEAPDTELLHEQKLEGLDPFLQWWRESLEEGRLIGFDAEGWPEQVDKENLRVAYRRYRIDRGISGREPQAVAMGKLLRRACPSAEADQRRREGERLVPVYRFPGLGKARTAWNKFIGHAHEWGENGGI